MSDLPPRFVVYGGLRIITRKYTEVYRKYTEIVFVNFA